MSISSIALSSNSKSSLAVLNDLARQISNAQTRLATGKRVNNPSDDAAAYFTAANLNSRASTLNTMLDAMNAGQKTFDAANAGIKAIQGLIQSAQGLANQALSSASTLVKVTGNNSTALTASTVLATTLGSSTKLKAGDTITVGDGTTTATYTAANNDTVQTFLSAVNGTANLKVAASLNASGQIQLLATGTNSVVVGGTVASTSGLNGATGLTAATTAFTANSTRQSLAQQFDALRTQVDQVVQDSSYNGVNLLNGGALSLNFNETGTSKLTVSGGTITSTSLGIPTANSGGGGQFQTDAEINSALSSLTSALTSLQAQSSAIGSQSGVLETRRAFMSSLAGLLSSGADDLVSADTTEDSALLTALQTRQQLATVALSMSGQRDQSALRLLGLS